MNVIELSCGVIVAQFDRFFFLFLGYTKI